MSFPILKQSFIHEYYSPRKGPLAMDAKPLPVVKSNKRKRYNVGKCKSKKKVESVTKELVSDESDVELVGFYNLESIKPQSTLKKDCITLRNISSKIVFEAGDKSVESITKDLMDDVESDVELVSIYNLESVNQQNVLKENYIPQKSISPKIVFETGDKCVDIKAWEITELSDADVVDSCKSVSWETQSNIGYKIPEDIKITKSPKQSTDLKRKSRVLELDLMINAERVSKETSLRTEEFNKDCSQANMLGEINNLSKNIGRESFNETGSQNEFELDGNEAKISVFLSHICEITSYVMCNDADLLFEEDKLLLEKFCAMSDKYKFFCCKLFTHQVKWYDFNDFAKKIKLSIGSTELQQMYTFLKENSIILTGIVYFSFLSQLNIGTFS